MEKKLKCPHPQCGRCAGVFVYTDEENTICKVDTQPPKEIKEKQQVFHTTCQRCKKEIYIIMGFKD